MVHYGTGRLSLKGSCSIRAPEVGGAGGAWRDGVSLCCETLPQAAGSLSAPEALYHPACSGTRVAFSAVTPRSHSSSTPFHPLRKDKDFIIVSGGIKHSEIRESGAIKKNIKNHELPGRVHKKHMKLCVSYCFSCSFLCLSSESFCSNVRLLSSCPQESVRSSAASAAPLSPRRATYCVTSSSIQGRNPSSVTCAATPVAGGTPSPAIYAPTRVSMGSSPTQKTAGWKPLQKGMRRSAVHMRSVL